MALVDAALEANLLTLFTEMEAGPMGKEVYAGKLAKIIGDQIRTAGIPAGAVVVSVTGDAVGTPNPAEINVE